MTTLTIAPVNQGTVFQNDRFIIAWTPEAGDWTEDGQYATALLTESLPDGDFIMVGFNATTHKDLQKFVDAYFDLSPN